MRSNQTPLRPALPSALFIGVWPGVAAALAVPAGAFYLHSPITAPIANAIVGAALAGFSIDAILMFWVYRSYGVTIGNIKVALKNLVS